jgi:hypothetical protein
MTNIKDKIKVQQPREVYTTLRLDGSNCALRDLKQVQNAKYQQKKETKPTNQKSANNSSLPYQVVVVKYGDGNIDGIQIECAVYFYDIGMHGICGTELF